MDDDTATIKGIRLTEEQRVLLWRSRELMRAGYDQIAADAISIRMEIDLHRAVALTRNGCSSAVALRILL